jgi:DNA invertase Pin-like site-specific DNA recombinase
MLAAKARKFDVLLVWNFDRFERSVQHLLRALDTFNKLGIGFVSFTEGIDTNTPMGKFTLTVLGAVGELERSMIIERTKAGLRRVKANGKQLGIKSTIDIAQARALRAQGLTFAEIGTQLNVSRTAISNALNREIAA